MGVFSVYLFSSIFIFIIFAILLGIVLLIYRFLKIRTEIPALLVTACLILFYRSLVDAESLFRSNLELTNLLLSLIISPILSVLAIIGLLMMKRWGIIPLSLVIILQIIAYIISKNWLSGVFFPVYLIPLLLFLVYRKRFK